MTDHPLLDFANIGGPIRMTDRTDMIDALDRWFPPTTYPFRGGPLDGQEHAVQMHRTDHCMTPPAMWRVGQLPPGVFAPDAPERMNDAEFRVHTYQFKITDGINRGYYDYVSSERCFQTGTIQQPLGVDDIVRTVVPPPFWQVVLVFFGVVVGVALLTSFVAAMGSR